MFRLPDFDFSKGVTITAAGVGTGVIGKVIPLIGRDVFLLFAFTTVPKHRNPHSSLPAAEQTVLSLIDCLMSPF